MRAAFLGVVSVCVVVAAVASQSPRGDARKAPWEWTLEERLAKRLDPVARKRRVDVAVAGRNRADDNRPVDVIRGTSDPELLMLSEIYTTFMRVAYGYEDEIAREFRRDALNKAVVLGLPQDFLDVVERESEEFLRLQRRELELEERMYGGGTYPPSAPSEIRNLRSAQCSVRAAAIRRLRQIFGVRKFDQFLYSAIAPGVFYDFLEPTPTAATLRAREEGCE